MNVHEMALQGWEEEEEEEEKEEEEEGNRPFYVLQSCL